MQNVVIYDKLEELNEGIEYNGGGITTLLGKGCVKSVQRGTFNKSNSSSTIQISISPINPDKSLLVLIDNGFQTTSQNTRATYTLNANYILVNSPASSWYSYISWQVIEFY